MRPLNFACCVALAVLLPVVANAGAINKGKLVNALGNHGQLTLASSGVTVDTTSESIEGRTAWVMASPNGSDCYYTVDGSTSPDTNDFTVTEDDYIIFTRGEFVNLMARGVSGITAYLNYQQYDRYPGQ